MNFFYKVFFITIGLLIPTAGSTQSIHFESSFSASGYLSSEDELPFWMITNKNGSITSKTDGLFQGGTKATYDFSEKNNATLTAGASLFIRNGLEDKVQRNELYLQFENSWLRAVVGAKNPSDRFQGLSVVEDNFLLSGNARAIPGVLLETTKPILISETIGIEGGIGHYELNDQRVTDGAMLHYKKLYANWQISNKNQLRFGIEHYAQWGGTSPIRGKQGESFNDFIDIFFAKRAGGEAFIGEQRNALGNHLGIYNLEYTYAPAIGSFKLYHQHPFEDGSGTALKNFPDGIWGMYYKPNQEDYTGFMTGFLLEYIQTTDQSGTDKNSGSDNYFNNSTYSSGWTYEKSVIGLAFIGKTPRNSLEGFYFNNRIRAIHIGVSGTHKNWSFLTKHTYSENLGSYAVPLDKKEKSFYSTLVGTYFLEKYGNISLILGFDYSNLNPEQYGAGLTYSYHF